MQPATTMVNLPKQIREWIYALEVSSEERVTQSGRCWVLQKGKENLLDEIQKILPENLADEQKELRAPLETLRHRVQRLADDTPAKQVVLQRLNGLWSAREVCLLEEIEKGLPHDCFTPFKRDEKGKMKPEELERFRVLLNKHPIHLELTDTAEKQLTAQDYILAAKRVVNRDFITTFSAYLPPELQTESQAEQAGAYIKGMPEIPDPSPMIFDADVMTTIPPEIALLNNLVNVSFFGTFHIPQALLSMQNLTQIQVTGWEGGVVPDWIYAKTNLISLEIGNMKFDLSLLGHLKYLSLSNVPGDALPASIGNLGNLIGLSIIHNQYRTLHSDIGKLSALKKFRIFSNTNLAQLPAELGNLTNLVKLMLYGCFETLPDEIGNLCNLKSLRLVTNQPLQLPDSLGKLRALETIECDANLPHLFPESLVHCSKLKKILGKNRVVLWSHEGGITLVEFLRLARKHPESKQL